MFMKNPNLRGLGELVEFTPDELQSYFMCAEDIIYFAEKYFYIVSIDKGKHKIQLFDYQKKALKVFVSQEVDGRKNAIVLLPRQMGKCIFADSNLIIRDTQSGEIVEVSISELFLK